jgi:hypothetical protein
MPDISAPSASRDSAALTPAEAARQRLLLRIVIGLGLAILLALAGVIYGMVQRAQRASPSVTGASLPATTTSLSGQLPASVQLALPAGAQIRTLALDGNRMSVHYEAPSGTGIALIDLARGVVLTRIQVVPEPPR